ncbi:MAG: GIY-YIG nuclease family protein [Longicatena sp.]
MIPDHDGYYVYVIKCRNRSYYTGWTTNLKQRFYQHAIGKGAKYTRAFAPLELFYYEQLTSKVAAQKREYEIKQYSHKQKTALKQ